MQAVITVTCICGEELATIPWDTAEAGTYDRKLNNLSVGALEDHRENCPIYNTNLLPLLDRFGNPLRGIGEEPIPQ